VAVHGVPLPDGDLSAVWRLVTSSGVAAHQAAGQTGTVSRIGTGEWAVVTDAPVLPAVITRATASTLEFFLEQAPDLSTWILDMSPWTWPEVLGPQTAERLNDTASDLRADLIARVVVFKDLGGGYARHLAPGVRITTTL